MTVIPACQLTPHELAQLGNNTAAAVRLDRESCRPASISPPPSHDQDDIDEQVEAAMRSEHVAS